MTAILSTIVLHKKFSWREIFGIIGVLVFAVLFSLAKHTVQTSEALYKGSLFALAFIVLSSVGGVVSEKVLKTQTQFLSIQYFYSKVAAVAVSIPLYLFHQSNSGDFFAYFDYRTAMVIVQYGVSGFIVTAITRSLSSTAKNITQSASAAVAQLLTIISTDWMHISVQSVASSNSDPLVILCAVGIIASVILFHSSSTELSAYEPIIDDDIELAQAVHKNHHHRI